ncbi:hypothetical protein ABZ490_34680 [Streptomyces sp. NPDC005811]|uniref:hypothetical protein n=1 Tax=Streptomyces sp. NPDC005811 TaxID=3154565 RepID=UPI0033CEE7C1
MRPGAGLRRGRAARWTEPATRPAAGEARRGRVVRGVCLGMVLVVSVLTCVPVWT